MEYKSPRIIALEIEDFDIESGVDGIALVESPAIEEDFYLFSKQDFQSYTDYPKQAQENAQIALRWAEENGWGSCGTPVGKQRANQLAKGEPISEETIARMAAFERHRQNSDKELGDGCGRLMWLAWGGDAGVEWAQRKLREIRGEDFQGEMEIDIYGYTTQYFFMCPGAIATFLDYKEYEVDEDTKGMIRSAAQIADNIFRIEYKVINQENAELEELGEAQVLVDDFYDLIGEIDKILGITTDVSYMEGHLEVIKGYIDELVLQYLIKKEFSVEELSEEQEELVVEHLEGLGETEEELLAEGWVKIDEGHEFAISSTPDLPSIDDSGERIYRYKYSGPVDSKNRSFCSKIMSMDKLYRKEDINQMTITGENSQFAQKGSFTYDIFQFAGGKYCRHKWIKVPFKKQDVKSQFSQINKEKQLIAGPLMIPRKLISRFNEFTEERFYVYFTEETIEKIAYKYLMNKYQDQTNLEHSEDIKLKDVILVESWLVEDPEKDKSYFLTGKKYPKGTWFGIMKVLNKTVWKEWIKTGRVKGFSVEGYFSDRIINNEKNKFYYRTTKGGTEIVIDHNSLVVFLLKDGERESILADGDYQLDNGKTLQVVDSKAVRGSF
jgi:hypothetical protein